jgi:hypothetical protein
MPVPCRHHPDALPRPAATCALATGGLGSRLAAVLKAGARLTSDSVEEGCLCVECRPPGRPRLSDLLVPSLRQETEWLIGLATEYRRVLWILFTHACAGKPRDDDALETTAHLIDTLGMPLTDVVYQLTLREFGDRTGTCPLCETGAHPVETEDA